MCSEGGEVGVWKKWPPTHYLTFLSPLALFRYYLYAYIQVGVQGVMYVQYIYTAHTQDTLS